DIDLLILAEDDAVTAQRDAIERFFARLWDAGLSPGHAVRSQQQCLQEGQGDATVATTLLEARYLAGDGNAAVRLLRAVRSESFWSAERFFDAKREEQRQR